MLALLLLTSHAHATLYDRSGGLIYDDVLDVTWLQDANYAMTSGYDSDGLMTWEQASNWATALVFSGYGDWRLPEIIYGQSYSSEMQSLYRSLLGPAQQQGGLNTLATNHNDSYDLFDNITPTLFWLSDPTNYVTQIRYPVVDMTDGTQFDAFQGNTLRAWAVRDGDVATVPEPATWAMLLAGLGLIAAGVRRNEKLESRHQKTEG